MKRKDNSRVSVKVRRVAKTPSPAWRRGWGFDPRYETTNAVAGNYCFARGISKIAGINNLRSLRELSKACPEGVAGPGPAWRKSSFAG